MKKTLLVISVLVISYVGPLTNAQNPHPWLASELAKQRYPCPAGTSPVRGPADAQVTIVEFIDFECPYCAQDEKAIRKVLAAYPAQVKLVVKNLPLEIHPKAKHKAILAECMGAQGKYWQAHDEMLEGAPPQKVRQGADQHKLDACIQKGGDGQVAEDLALAKHLGMASTPSFVVDGIRQGGMIQFEQFKLLVDAEIARKNAPKQAANVN